MYQKADVPSVIQISVPKFQVDGGMHPAVTLNVLSTVAKGSSVAIELTTDNLEFLRAAAHSKELQVQRLKRKHAEHDMPELTAPSVYWRRRGATKPTIMCNYLSEDGVWRTHNQTPVAIDDHDAYVKAVREAEFRVQEFFDDNHHAPADEAGLVEAELVGVEP